MAFAADCRKVHVEPRASDTGSDRADIEICDFCSNGKLVCKVSTARASAGTNAAHVPGVAALSVEKAKRLHYGPLTASRVPPATFFSLALELDCRWGAEQPRFIEQQRCLF